MMQIYIEIIGNIDIYIGMGLQIIMAFILGGVVGLDREKKLKSAGIKTNILICLGATLYTSISLVIQKANGMTADPNRVIAQIVSGIGFLGAGAIIQSRGNIIGLTTAATIWTVAAIGVTIGAGFPVIAAIFTITTLAILKILNPIYSLLSLQQDYYIEVHSRRSVKNNIVAIILSRIDSIKGVEEKVKDPATNEQIVNITISIHPNAVPGVIEEIKGIPGVIKVHYYRNYING